MNRLTFLQPRAENEDSAKRNRVIKIIKYPDDSILHSIAKRHCKTADQVIQGLVNVISTAHYHSDFFCTIMYNDNGKIISCANFIQSSSEPSKWLYTDLWTAPECRRQGCAAEIVNAGRQHLSELNAKTLLCMVEPHNEASLNLQKHLGFICDLLTHPSNVSALHLKRICDNECPQFYKEMREALLFSAAEDELNYIIRKGVVPIAWLKLNGLSNDSLWINMLIVHEKYRNLGVGMSALEFVEEFASSTRRRHIYINTASDNLVAQSLYKKAGYIITEETIRQNEDKTESAGYTLHKEISFN